MSEPNFEAMGRYQHAMTQVRELTVKKSTLLVELKRWCERALTGSASSMDFAPIETEAAFDYLEALRDVNAKLAAAVTECNIWADEAQARRIKCRPMA